jgi:hypothetical protein
MKLSGRNIRRIYSNGVLAFDLDMELTEVTGSAFFGISGVDGSTPKSTLFNFKSGRVIDPNGKNVYSYQRNAPINLKGTFLSETYDYFIDDNLISSAGTKEDYTIEKFFFESEGCEIELNDLNFYGPTGSLDLSKNMTFGANIHSDSIGSAGNIGHGNVGDSTNVSTSTSKAGDYMSFANAITFNPSLPIKGDVISGEVTLGSEFFEFDNRESYLKTLSGVVGNVGDGSNIKDLSLKANVDLTDGAYPLQVTFYTNFGNIARNAIVLGGSVDNPSGIKVNILGDGFPLQSGQNTTHSLSNSNGDPVSGEFGISYSADLALGEDLTEGLPYKIYLEHVEGDHSKNYSFVTGVQLSGSGKGYIITDEKIQAIKFRTGDVGSSNPIHEDGAEFGYGIGREGAGGIVEKERASGLVSESDEYKGMITEAHLDSIRTNLYVGDGAAASSTYNIHKMSDGHVMTQYSNVADIVTIFDAPTDDSVSNKEQPSGIAQVLSYQKLASDWQLFTGHYSHNSNSYIEHTATGISDTPLKRHGGGQELFLGAVLKAKNYVDTDPMVYNLVFSGADGYGTKHTVTGTVMETGYNMPLTSKI